MEVPAVFACQKLPLVSTAGIRDSWLPSVHFITIMNSDKQYSSHYDHHVLCALCQRWSPVLTMDL